jgi:hypothetical protein
VAVYLGPSPQHGSAIGLLLSLTTGHVSPQFHAVYDDHFDTARADSSEKMPLSMWQRANYFDDALIKDPSQHVRIGTDGAVPRGRANRAVLPPNQPVNRQVGTSIPVDQIPEPVGTPAPQPIVTTQSGRAVRTPSRYLDSFVARLEYDGSAELQYQEQHPMVVFKATKDPDNLYLDQAMRAPDSADFKKAMLKEVRDHETRGHWVIIRRNEVPEGSIVLPAVWAMKRKRDIKTRKIFKWKARLNLGGHKERPELDYGKTYSPVVAWPTIRLFLVHFLLKGWMVDATT